MDGNVHEQILVLEDKIWKARTDLVDITVSPNISEEIKKKLINIIKILDG